jgi:hypothetical protein
LPCLSHYRYHSVHYRDSTAPYGTVGHGYIRDPRTEQTRSDQTRSKDKDSDQDCDDDKDKDKQSIGIIHKAKAKARLDWCTVRVR